MTDLPCPHCNLGPVVAVDSNDNPLPGTRVWCTACGERWDATELVRLRVERDDALHAATLARRQRDDVLDMLADRRRERDALRAIVEGRTTPPTDEEVYAHGGPGRSGWWLVSSPDDMSLELIEQPKERDWCIRWGATQWLPIDLDGRPCAWPVVTEASNAR